MLTMGGELDQTSGSDIPWGVSYARGGNAISSAGAQYEYT